ncbi:hypothetical protein ScPMuIL_018808 [Solemya velum]
MGSQSNIVGDIVKFGSQTNGRDKLCRLVQYSSKLCSWSLEKYVKKDDIVEKLKKLEAALSMTRKVLRLGKSVDFMHSALKSIHLSDVILRLTITLSKVNQALFLLFDHIIWAHSIGLIKADKKKWSVLAARFWLVSLILNIARDCYEMSLVMNRECRETSQSSKSSYRNGDANYRGKSKSLHVVTNMTFLKKYLEENKPVVMDLVKNVSDLILPMTTLGYTNASPGLQGFLGTVSSLVGVVTIWNPLLRLVP